MTWYGARHAAVGRPGNNVVAPYHAVTTPHAVAPLGQCHGKHEGRSDTCPSPDGFLSDGKALQPTDDRHEGLSHHLVNLEFRLYPLDFLNQLPNPFFASFARYFLRLCEKHFTPLQCIKRKRATLAPPLFNRPMNRCYQVDSLTGLQPNDASSSNTVRFGQCLFSAMVCCHNTAAVCNAVPTQ